MTRSNRRTEFLLIADNGVRHADRFNGNGFGAFAKAADRCITAVTGWAPADTRFEFDGVTVTMTHRTTGEIVRAEYVEAA